ncbi:MAG: NUDIX hydrolase [Bdellovibrionota bacterium]
MGIWRETSRKLVYKSRIFDLFNIGFKSEKSGKEGQFDIIETKDWVNVLAITDQNEAIMVRQFRYGISDLTLEFPAGMIETGQTPLEAAKRELREETGGTATSIEPIGVCHSNPAIFNNRCFHYVAKGVVAAEAQELDEYEEIEVVRVPLANIDQMIAEGKITHALALLTWYFFRSPK